MSTDGQSICFSQYPNDSLRIDVINGAFEIIKECTVETDAIDEFEDMLFFSEKKNDRIRRMHRYNLIVAIAKEDEEALRLLRSQNIIQAIPEYLEKQGNNMLAYYKLTDHAITQKCDIIDEDSYIQLYSDEIKEHLQGLPYNDFIYRVKDGRADFAGIYFDGKGSYFEYGVAVASSIQGIRNYLKNPDRSIQYAFHGDAEQVYQKLFQLRRRVENRKELIK